MDTESNSIRNQRELIKNYISGKDDFKDALLIDYIDDGISGVHSERKAYQRLLSDIERGVINCVVVKDLSRLGRNLIDVGDLIINRLTALNVRLIAINDDYDSLSCPRSNFELAIINLMNQHYSRDLAEKSISAKRIKAKRGEHLAGAPFGYKKSVAEKNKLIPDAEAAGYVRLIYSLAVEGRKAVEIAQRLNAYGIPSPLTYKIGKGYIITAKQAIDPNYCFWTNVIVRKLIMNEVYVGKVISNKSKVTEPGVGRTIPRPESEWIIIPNAHEPLVSEHDFQKAQLIISRKKYTRKCSRKLEHIFGNKVKCSACGRAMIRHICNNPYYKCSTVKFTDYYGCGEYHILQSDVESIVLDSVRDYMSAWSNREKLELARIQKSKAAMKEIDEKIAVESKEIRLLESCTIKSFEDFVSDKMAKEDFIYNKNAFNDIIEQKRSEIKHWSEQLRSMADECYNMEKAIAELKPFTKLDALNREIIDILIDRIIVRSEKEIEIVWNRR